MKEFQPVSELLRSRLPKSEDPPAPEAAQRLLRELWRGNAGRAGLHSHPLLFSSGRVAVFVESPLWASELRHRAPSLVRALRQGGIGAHRLEIRLRPAEAPVAVAERRAPGFTPGCAGLLATAAGQLSHPGLKEAMARLARLAREEEEKS